jgi:hypothetical protein
VSDHARNGPAQAWRPINLCTPSQSKL